MMYQKADGTRFVLVHHSNSDWAAEMRERLLALGCSLAYANRISKEIASAEPA